MVNERRHGADGLDPADQVGVDVGAMGDLRPRIGSREQAAARARPPSAYVNRHVAIRVAIHLDAGTVDALDPGIQFILGLATLP